MHGLFALLALVSSSFALPIMGTGLGGFGGLGGLEDTGFTTCSTLPFLGTNCINAGIYSPDGYPGMGYPGMGYPGMGYPGMGYPGSRYPGIGYPGGNYRGSTYGGISAYAPLVAPVGVVTPLLKK